jgi:hypothetical protein
MIPKIWGDRCYKKVHTKTPYLHTEVYFGSQIHSSQPPAAALEISGRLPLLFLNISRVVDHLRGKIL